jgi:ferredoxin
MALISHGTRTTESRRGATLFECADELALRVPTSCGRFGHCHECIVEVTQGIHALTPRNEAESFLRGNFRLACQAVIQDAECGVEFALLQRSPRILSGQPAATPLEIDPVVERRGNRIFYDGEELDHNRGRV